MERCVTAPWSLDGACMDPCLYQERSAYVTAPRTVHGQEDVLWIGLRIYLVRDEYAHIHCIILLLHVLVQYSITIYSHAA
jgi:hypothetical protein